MSGAAAILVCDPSCGCGDGPACVTCGDSTKLRSIRVTFTGITTQAGSGDPDVYDIVDVDGDPNVTNAIIYSYTGGCVGSIDSPICVQMREAADLAEVLGGAVHFARLGIRVWFDDDTNSATIAIVGTSDPLGGPDSLVLFWACFETDGCNGTYNVDNEIETFATGPLSLGTTNCADNVGRIEDMYAAGFGGSATVEFLDTDADLSSYDSSCPCEICTTCTASASGAYGSHSATLARQGWTWHGVDLTTEYTIVVEPANFPDEGWQGVLYDDANLVVDTFTAGPSACPPKVWTGVDGTLAITECQACAGCSVEYLATLIDAAFPETPIEINIEQTEAGACEWTGDVDIEALGNYDLTIELDDDEWLATLVVTNLAPAVSTYHFRAPVGCESACPPSDGWVFEEGEPEDASMELEAV